MSSEAPPQNANAASPAPHPLAAHPVSFAPASAAAITSATTTTDVPHDNTSTSEDGRSSGLAGGGVAPPSPAAELARERVKLKAATRHFADFPIQGINFIDIMPLFARPDTHQSLLNALYLQATTAFPIEGIPDVVVGLDARGFLFGPGLALRLGTGFAPVRKKGKLPGPCVTAAYEKEYGTDLFQMQTDAVKPGQRVLVVDDIIATGGSAKAAGDLVRQLGGEIIGFLFVIEILGLGGRDKLGDTPIAILLEDA